MEPTATFDARQLRDVLGTFVTGVTVITTSDGDGVPHGVTANSFSSVSLDPPLVLWSQSLSSRSYDAFHGSAHFAVHILAHDQIDVSNHFAKSQDEKFEGVAFRRGVGEVPLLEGTAAHLECVKVAEYPGGDHVVYVGRVERIAQLGRRPLAFGRGKYMVAYAHDLGPTALRLGTTKPADSRAIRVALDSLPELSSRLGEHTLCLAAWGNHGPTALHWEPSSQPVSDQLRPGLVMSITRSATGRAFAAFLPEEMTRHLVDEDLNLSDARRVDGSLGRADFDAEMLETRTRGVARAVGSSPSHLHQIAVNAFSVPIRNPEGHMILALSVTSNAQRMSPDFDGEVPRALAAGANEISARIASTLPSARAA
jgi:flavin reductase (DIM6/NTAB) family NADH-FMN oxidoreductase RutF/DNA-binding IclR family transcriptional regulator